MMANNTTQAPRQSRAFWQEHTEQWKQSGLSKIAYSKEHNLKPVSFYNWSKKLEYTDSPSPTIAGSLTTFAPVQIEPGTTKLHNADRFVHIECATIDIALPVDLTSEQIHNWLQAIHALHV